MFLSASAEIAAEAVLLPGVDLHVAAFQAERGSVARLHGFPGSRRRLSRFKGNVYRYKKQGAFLGGKRPDIHLAITEMVERVIKIMHNRKFQLKKCMECTALA